MQEHILMCELRREQLENKFNHKFDDELKQANLSLIDIHRVLDRMGAPHGNGTEGATAGQRLRGLVCQRINREEERLQIGCNFHKVPRWKLLAGVPLIYIPILAAVLPMIVAALLVRTHLTMVGGRKLKSYWNDFVPSWVSHRYTRDTQIVSDKLLDKYGAPAYIAKSKLFWIFNCKLYCPLSVALLAYLLYLVKIVEQWWCPFAHDKKATYADAPIDKSLWHVDGDEGLLHPDDRENPSWNQDAP